MLNSNALITMEQYLIYAGKYTETALTGQSLADSGDHLTFSFPNEYLVEGTVVLYEAGDPDPVNITADIDTIDYVAGNVTFNSEHTGVTADYTYLAFNYANRYRIEAQINAASEFVNRYLDRNLKLTEYTDEEYAGNYRQRLLLKQWPIVELDTVKIDDATLDESYYSMSPDDAVMGAIFKQDGWPSESYLVGYVGEPGPKLRSIKVTYTAGYATIPADIQNVCCKMVTEALNQQKNNSQGLQSIDQGELSYKWYSPEGMVAGNGVFGVAMNPEYAAVLNRHKRHV